MGMILVLLVFEWWAYQRYGANMTREAIISDGESVRLLTLTLDGHWLQRMRRQIAGTGCSSWVRSPSSG